MIGQVSSQPMSVLLAQALENSDNVLAEALARQVAIARGAPPSFDGASAAIIEALEDLKIDTIGVEMYDGSGISTKDRVPPAVLAQVVALAVKGETPALRNLLTGLPVAGVSGSLADRFQDPDPRPAPVGCGPRPGRSRSPTRWPDTCRTSTAGSWSSPSSPTASAPAPGRAGRAGRRAPRLRLRLSRSRHRPAAPDATALLYRALVGVTRGDRAVGRVARPIDWAAAVRAGSTARPDGSDGHRRGSRRRGGRPAGVLRPGRTRRPGHHRPRARTARR